MEKIGYSIIGQGKIDEILSNKSEDRRHIFEELKAQSEKAKQYLNLKEELKNIEIGLFLYNIEKYKQNLEEIVEEEEIYTSQCKEEEEKLERIKQLKEELKNDKPNRRNVKLRICQSKRN